MEDSTLRLVIFSFVLSMLFPIFAYTFTTFGNDPSQYDITLDVTQLENSGIKLTDAVTHNITFGSPAEVYAVKNQTMRVQWKDRLFLPDYWSFQQQSYIERVFGTWVFPVEMGISFNPSQGFLLSGHCENQSIMINFDNEYNWTSGKIVENGLTLFWTTSDADANNISKAIYETGSLNVTVATEAISLDDGNFENFGNWYMQVVTGQDDDWGLPSFMSWIVRIFGFLSLLSAMLLLKEFVPFLN